MAILSKKTAIASLFIVAGLVALWKFIWQGSTPETMPTSETKDSKETSLKADEKKLSAKTSYKNPGGSDEVGFNVIVDGSGTITGASVDILAVNGIAKKRQESFSEGFPTILAGKKLSELGNIDKVGGSSLTTAAFNNALPWLKSQL